jgi:hypothetical protein
MKSKDDILLEQAYSTILKKQRILKEEADDEVELQTLQNLLEEIKHFCTTSPKNGSTRGDIGISGTLPVWAEIDAAITDAGYNNIGRVQGWGAGLENPNSDTEAEIADHLQCIADINMFIDMDDMSDEEKFKNIYSRVADHFRDPEPFSR